VKLDNHLIHFGPYALVTVDEGYAAVTQDNEKQRVLDGGHTHLLTHINWKFEKCKHPFLHSCALTPRMHPCCTDPLLKKKRK
jgi:hypothetical protein